MSARSLRFVRSLVLASGAAATACDKNAMLEPDSASDAETATDTNPDIDAVDSAASLGVPDSFADSIGDETSANGACRVVTPDGGPDLPCEAGGACSYPDDATTPRCTFGIDAAGIGSNWECGGITCGEYCYCAGPAASLCGCLHAAGIGPLPPPELPIRRSPATARARRVLRRGQP